MLIIVSIINIATNLKNVIVAIDNLIISSVRYCWYHWFLNFQLLLALLIISECDMINSISKGVIRGHPLMMTHILGDFQTPLPLCHTKLPFLLRPSYIVSQKCQPPSPYMCDVIYEQPLITHPWKQVTKNLNLTNHAWIAKYWGNWTILLF